MSALSEAEQRKLNAIECALAGDAELARLADRVGSTTSGWRQRWRRIGYRIRPSCRLGWALVGLASLLILGGVAVLIAGLVTPWIVAGELFCALPLIALGVLIRPRRRPSG